MINDIPYSEIADLLRLLKFDKVSTFTEKWCCPQRTDAWEASWSQPSWSLLLARVSIKGRVVCWSLVTFFYPGLSINIRSSLLTWLRRMDLCPSLNIQVRIMALNQYCSAVKDLVWLNDDDDKNCSSGNAIASEESVRVTPSLRSQKGMIWSKEPTNFDW